MADNVSPVVLGVDKAHPDYEKFKGKWKRVRDTVAGEETVHKNGTAYLPKLKDESPEDYNARVGRTAFYNATWRTMSALVGMLFRKDPTVTVAKTLDPILADVTMTGVPFVNFCKELGNEIIGPGMAGVLIDHPPRPDTGDRPLVKADAEKLGLRPKLALYKCEAVFNWQHRLINNTWTLSQVRLKETVDKYKSEFEVTQVEQIRVLDLDPLKANTYRQRLYQKGEDSQWRQVGGDIVPLMNNQPLTAIPFVFMTANGIVAELDEPPLIDLVDLNLKHYQVSADYEHACHFTALPTPWIAGLSPKIGADGAEVPQSYYIGSTVAWVFSNPETSVGFLEYTGQGIDALKGNLESKEGQMAAIGARLLAPEKSGVEAADTLAMRHSGENSVLSSIANSLSQGMSKALEWLSLWAGASEASEVNVNRDFMPVAMDAATLTGLISAWQSGGISEQELFEQLQRGDVVASDKEFDEHKAEIDSNPPMGLLASQAAIDALENPDPKGDTPKDKKDA